MAFSLHPQLAADTIAIGELASCKLLLMNNRRFPWLILVPRQEGARELFDLNDVAYHAVMQEVRLVTKALSQTVSAHKMNVAALGNMVPQLHIHVIARFEKDAAWPQPVWSANLAPEAYSQSEIDMILGEIRETLAL